MILILLVLMLMGFISQKEFLDLTNQLIEKSPELKIQEPQKQEKVILPPPIRTDSGIKGTLTKEGVIYFTNLERIKKNLPPLKENKLLNHSAEIKLEDIFEKQYFAHISPEGESIKDLVKKVGYEFILIGENLALGNFKNDESLVNRWMESQDHRENILNPKYQEIGVAVRKGVFEGREVWIAVQHFGTPLSACPVPDENLKKEIDEKEQTADILEIEINKLEEEIDHYYPKSGSEYQEKVNQYNLLVEKYNSLIRELKNLINNYNNQVSLFNQCLSNF